MENAMKRRKLDVLLGLDASPGQVRVNGWVRTKRDSKEFCFLEINDGSSLANIQIIANNDLTTYDQVQKLTTGSAVGVIGQLVASPGKGQKWEIQAEEV